MMSSDTSSPSTAVAATPGRRAGLALAIGIVVGSTALSCGAVAGEVPRADASAACEALRRNEAADPGADARSHRWSGALELAIAAGEGAAPYRPLADALQRAQEVRSRTLSDESPELATEIGTVRDLCSRLVAAPKERDGRVTAASAATDAQAACAALERNGSVDVQEQANLHRWNAARALAMAAAAGDSRYQPLADALQKARAIHASTFSVDSPEFATAMRQAGESCAEL